MTMTSNRPSLVAPRIWGDSWTGMNAHQRHQKLVNDYVTFYQKPNESLVDRPVEIQKTDRDILHENWRFVRSEEDNNESTWEKRMAKRYYDRLFKEYCISDLKHFKEGKIALRWRTEKEVLDGKGQFLCGDKRCNERNSLKSWEVNFGYVENGEKKNALVKLRLCPACSSKLNHRRQMREAAAARKKARKTESGEPDSPVPKRPKINTPQSDNGESESGASNSSSAASTPRTVPGGEMSESDHWKGSAPTLAVDKTREEEYDDYFQDLML